MIKFCVQMSLPRKCCCLLINLAVYQHLFAIFCSETTCTVHVHVVTSCAIPISVFENPLSLGIFCSQLLKKKKQENPQPSSKDNFDAFML